eukprot:gene6499-2519_t
MRSNTAGSAGGAVSVRGKAGLAVAKARIVRNRCAQSGGAFHLDAGSSARFEDADLAANAARVGGGGVALAGSAGLAARRVSISRNFATDPSSAGGAVHLIHHSAATLSNCTVAGNRAQGGGGVAAQDSARLELTGDTVVRDNTAAEWKIGDEVRVRGAGGAVHNGSVTALFGGLEINNIPLHNWDWVKPTVMFCQADSYINISTVCDGLYTRQGAGGGICAKDVAQVVAHSVRLLDNRAGFHGGGLFTADIARAELSGSAAVRGNVARKGGGVYAQYSARLFADRSSTFARGVAFVNRSQWCGAITP